MKRRFGREIALLTLPVVIFGGIALWKTRGGSMAQLQGAPSDIYSGPPRVEFGEIKSLILTPRDVAQGFVWGVDTQIWQGGQNPVAADVKRPQMTYGRSRADVFYKRGARWIKAEGLDGRSLTRHGELEEAQFGDFAIRRRIQIKVRLDGVPRDAEEIRLRGTFIYENDYQLGCRGASGGSGWKFYPSGVCILTTQSKPFDIPIVKPKQAWPKPNVSRETVFQFVDAKYIVDPTIDYLVLQIRRKDGSDWKQRSIVRENIQLLDNHQQPIELFDMGGGAKAQINAYGDYNQERFSPKRAKSDWFIMIAPVDSIEPKNGWDKVKFPLTLRAEISDGTCWPLKIDTKVERVQMRTEDFGAAK